MPASLPTANSLILALLLAIGISGLAKAVRSLSWSGFAAAVFVGFAMFGFGGIPAAAALLTFFLSSSLLSRIGKRRKEALAFEKGGERDAGQVLANGGVAAVAAFCIPFAGPDTHWPVAALLGALATANADTWATEIGSLAKGRPWRITDFKPAEVGESGAISLQGTLAALGGALLISLLGPWCRLPLFAIPLIAMAGLLGSLLDSLLGATLQEQFHDALTGKQTERQYADNGDANRRIRGLSGMNNDLVNLLTTLAGATLAVFLVW